MSATTVALSHPIVFVFDFHNDGFSVPELADDALVSANEGGISVRASSYVDGDVTIHLSRSPQAAPERPPIRAFDGKVNTPSGSIAVVTAENQLLLEENVGATRAMVRVYVDDASHPGVIWVEVQ